MNAGERNGNWLAKCSRELCFHLQFTDTCGAPLVFSKKRKQREKTPNPQSFSAQLDGLQDVQTEGCPSEMRHLNR